MMDFGFGAFLEKFEENFGRGATRLLLVLIGMAIFVFCSSLIWNMAIKPASEIVAPLLGSAFTRELGGSVGWYVGSIVGSTIIIGAVSITALSFASLALLHVQIRLAKRDLAKIDALSTRAEAALHRAIEADTASNLLLDDVVDMALERGLINPDQADLFRSLLSAEAGPPP